MANLCDCRDISSIFYNPFLYNIYQSRYNNSVALCNYPIPWITIKYINIVQLCIVSRIISSARTKKLKKKRKIKQLIIIIDKIIEN